MTLMCDKQITKLCELPKAVIVREIAVSQRVGDSEETQVVMVKTNTFTNLSYSEVVDLQQTKDGENIIDYRDLTMDEIIGLKPMIYPFVDHQVTTKIISDTEEAKVISSGVSSYGYDITLAPEFKVFTNINSTVIDPKNFDRGAYKDIRADICVIPPNSFVLARSREYFNMPNVVTGLVIVKSTYARCGIFCFSTVIEAGWSGNITLEFANTTSLPALLYANEGAAQVLFSRGDVAPAVTYADRKGKYQGQKGIQLPIV